MTDDDIRQRVDNVLSDRYVHVGDDTYVPINLTANQLLAAFVADGLTVTTTERAAIGEAVERLQAAEHSRCDPGECDLAAIDAYLPSPPHASR